MNVYDLFRERSRGNNPFLLSPQLEKLYDYEDLHRISANFATHIRAMGASPGDRILVQVEKSPGNLFLYFAALRAGLVYLPLNTAYLEDELAYFVQDAEPALVICDPARQELFTGLPGNHKVLTMDKSGAGSFIDGIGIDGTDPAGVGEAPFATEPRDDDDVAVILYTSGTTGKPKGAMISHGNLATNGLALLDAWQWQPDDIMLHALPVFHIHGLFVATHLPVLNGTPIILLAGFDPITIAGLLPAATVYMGVPTNYTRLLASGLLNRETCNNMRLFTSGSAPLLAQTFDEFREVTGHEIVERYGMTETGMNTSNPLDGRRKPGTVGPTLPGVSARIVGNDGTPVPAGEPGNLEISGPNVFRGYWNLPEKTAEEFTDDGYFRTGDVAMLDEDSYVSIVGRDKDMIISGGLNVYPKEIEAIIDGLPGVAESAVIGLPHPDFGEGVCAVIVTEADHNLVGDEVIAALKSKLANFKVPKWVFIEPELPRNTMGKVQKNLLREKFNA